MAKISHKKKSKRIPCKRRYSIQKKIRNHNKKLKKESKVNKNKKSSKLKDWHIPNKCPFKDELLNQTEELKQQIINEKQQKRAEAKQNRKLKTLEDIKTDAENKQIDYNNTSNADNADNTVCSDNSLKQFSKEFKKIVELSDIILEVLDARDPLGSRCLHVEQMILNSPRPKKLILLINKIDLIPKDNIQKWLGYLRNEYPTIAFKSSTQSQNEKLSQSKISVDYANEKLLNSSKCFGADILLKLLKNYCRNNEVKQAITVGVVGLPNTGKSSVINSLKRSQACISGSTPGLTRCVQEVKLDKNIKLLDSPGIVISKDGDLASLVLKNCVRVEQLEDPIMPVDLILKKCKRDDMMIHYKIDYYNDVMQFLNLLAIRTGKMKKGGVPDIDKAAKQVLNDWNNGKIPYFTTPPEKVNLIDTKFVNEMSKAFDIDSILQEENSLFNSMDGNTKIEVDAMEVESNQLVNKAFK